MTGLCWALLVYGWVTGSVLALAGSIVVVLPLAGERCDIGRGQR